jgi:uncharacterized heparinase superfamily protein
VGLELRATDSIKREAAKYVIKLISDFRKYFGKTEANVWKPEHH